MIPSDLPPGYDRHADAIHIVEIGACNPAGVALAIHNACRQVIAERGSQRTDPAVRPMTTQRALPVSGDADMPHPEWLSLRETCRPRPGRRRTLGRPTIA